MADQRSLIIALSCIICLLTFALLRQRSPSLAAVVGSQRHHTLVVPASLTLLDGSHSCIESTQDTDGYICVSDQSWRLRKANLLHQAGVVELSRSAVSTTPCSDYIQKNFEPSLSCEFEQRLGLPGDGGKWICDPHRIQHLFSNQSHDCVIMSLGSNNQFDFEESMRATFGPLCTIHTFDPTVAHPHPPPYVTYHDLGIAQHTGGKLRPLPELMEVAKAGLNDPRVEILKIDVEGYEYESLTTLLLEDDQLAWPRQILIETHVNRPTSDERPTEDLRRLHKLLAAFQHRGYAIFHKEPNLRGSFDATHKCLCAVEYSLLRLNIHLPPIPSL